jgi:hypothetical protein
LWREKVQAVRADSVTQTCRTQCRIDDFYAFVAE